MFSCEFCEISKNTFSYRTPPVATSKNLLKCHHLRLRLFFYLSEFFRRNMAVLFFKILFSAIFLTDRLL